MVRIDRYSIEDDIDESQFMECDLLKTKVDYNLVLEVKCWICGHKMYIYKFDNSRPPICDKCVVERSLMR